MALEKYSTATNNLRALRKRALLSVAALALVCCASASASAAQTKSFVVSWFTQAVYSQDGDCPKGFNPKVDALTRGQLKAMGKSPEEIKDFMKRYAEEPTTPALVSVLVNRGRIDGQPVNVYTYPDSIPDPKIHTIENRFGYGFNLDGKTSKDSFEDPQTHEKGVDNQVFRAVGCFTSHRAGPSERSLYSAYPWSQKRPNTQAWLISVTGENLEADGGVTVTFERALEHAFADVSGEVQRDVTFRPDSNPNTRSVFQGKLRGGVISVNGGNFNMLADPAIMPGYKIRDVQLRLVLEKDGSLNGFLGGYQPWLEVYYYYAGLGYPAEYTFAIDIPGVYHALKRLADAYPDPSTGRNTHISTTYKIEAMPAFVAPAPPATGDTQALNAQRF